MRTTLHCCVILRWQLMLCIHEFACMYACGHVGMHVCRYLYVHVHACGEKPVLVLKAIRFCLFNTYSRD